MTSHSIQDEQLMEEALCNNRWPSYRKSPRSYRHAYFCVGSSSETLIITPCYSRTTARGNSLLFDVSGPWEKLYERMYIRRWVAHSDPAGAVWMSSVCVYLAPSHSVPEEKGPICGGGNQSGLYRADAIDNRLCCDPEARALSSQSAGETNEGWAWVHTQKQTSMNKKLFPTKLKAWGVCALKNRERAKNNSVIRHSRNSPQPFVWNR